MKDPIFVPQGLRCSAPVHFAIMFVRAGTVFFVLPPL